MVGREKFDFVILKKAPLRSFLFLSLVLCILSSLVGPSYAVGNTGVLSGRVVDKDTSKGIENVFVTAKSPVETFTANTDKQGYFSIAGAPANSYDVTLERVGYQTGTYIGVVVTGDATTNLQFTIGIKPVEVAGVTVTAARTPIVNPRQTMTNYGYTNKEIRELFPGPLNLTITTIYETLPGNQTSLNDPYYGQNGPHIRGGTGSDIGYAFDGVPTYETITNTFGTNLTNVGTYRTDFYVGGYPSQYGNFLSGYVNQVAARGSGQVHGNIEYQYGMWLDPGSKLPSGSWPPFFRHPSADGLRIRDTEDVERVQWEAACHRGWVIDKLLR